MRQLKFSRGPAGPLSRSIIGVLLLSAALVGCGSSSSSSSSTTNSTSSSTSSSSSTSAPAAAAQPRVLPGTKAPSAAAKPSASTFKKLSKVPKGAGFKAHLAGIDSATTDQAINTLANDLNKFWSTEFANSGVQWPTVQGALVTSTPVQTGCQSRPTVAPTDAWYLCGTGSAPPYTYTFFWPVPWTQQNVDTDTGHASLAFNMAQMFGLLVQNVFGFTTQVSQGQMPKGLYAQQTLCLTGVYLRNLDDRKVIEQADVKTIQTIFNRLAQNINGITSPDVTPQQLQQAFKAGLDNGAPGTCGIQAAGSTTTTTSSTTS